MRSAQLDIVIDALLSSRDAQACNAGIILTGDFNFCSSWADENSAISDHPCLIDVWAALRPEDEGFTEDTCMNAMLLRSKNCDKRVRFDRIIFASSSRPSEDITDSYATPPSSPRCAEPLLSNFKEVLTEKMRRCTDASMTSQCSCPIVIPTSIDLTGTNPISGLQYSGANEVFPSDHFGLIASFKIE